MAKVNFDKDWWRRRLGELVRCFAGMFGPVTLRRFHLWPLLDFPGPVLDFNGPGDFVGHDCEFLDWLGLLHYVPQILGLS